MNMHPRVAIFAGLLLAIGSPALAAITRLQVATGSSASGTTCTVTLPNAIAAGSALVAVVGTNRYEDGLAASNFASGGGVTNWSKVTVQQNHSGGTIDVLVGTGATGAPGTNVITFTLGGSNQCQAIVAEYAGILATSPADKFAVGSGTNTSANSGQSATTTQADELWIGGFHVNSANTFSQYGGTGTGGSWAQVGQITSTSGSASGTSAMSERIVTATAQARATATRSGSGSDRWQAHVATFKADPCHGGSVNAGTDIHRAKRYEGDLEVDTSYVAPPGNPVTSFVWGPPFNQTLYPPAPPNPTPIPASQVTPFHGQVTLTMNTTKGCSIADSLQVDLYSDTELENFFGDLHGAAAKATLLGYRDQVPPDIRYFQALAAIGEFLVQSQGNASVKQVQTVGSLDLPQGTLGKFASTVQNGYRYYFMVAGEAARWFQVLRATVPYNAAAPIEFVGGHRFGLQQISFSIAYRDGYAYVAGTYGLDVIDVHDPASPFHVARWRPGPATATHYLKGVALHPTLPYLYVTAQASKLANHAAEDGVYVADISNPTAPVQVGDRWVYEAGGTSCTQTEYSAFPAGQQSGINTGSNLTVVAGDTNEHYLFVTNGWTGLWQFVISTNPLVPDEKFVYPSSHCPAASSAEHLAVAGADVWLTGFTTNTPPDPPTPHLSLYRRPGTPANGHALLSQQDPPALSAITSIAADAAHLFVGGYGSWAGSPSVDRPSLIETRLLDEAATLTSTRLLPYQTLSSSPDTLYPDPEGRLLVMDNWNVGQAYVYKPDGSGALPEPSSTLHLLHEARALAVANGNAYIGRASFVTVVDVSTPSAPALRTHLDLSGTGVKDLISNGSYIYGLISQTDVTIIDGSNAANPVVIDDLERPQGAWQPRRMCKTGNNKLVVMWTGGPPTSSERDPLVMYDIGGANAGIPVPEKTIYLNFDDHGPAATPPFPYPTSSWNMACTDQFAFFTGPSDSSPPKLRLYTVDLSENSWAGDANDWEDFDIAFDPLVTHLIKYDGTHLVMNNGLTKNMLQNDPYQRKAAGLTIFDVSNASQPKVAGQFRPYAWSNSGIGLMPGFPHVMASAYSADAGLRIFNLQSIASPVLAAYESPDILNLVATLYDVTGWDPGVLIDPYVYSAKLDHLEIFDLSAARLRCGDGVQQIGEECDGLTCQAVGCGGGLACTSACDLDMSACTHIGFCQISYCKNDLKCTYTGGCGVGNCCPYVCAPDPSCEGMPNDPPPSGACPGS